MPPVVKNNEPTHWFTIEFYENVVTTEEGVKDQGAIAQKSTRKTTQKQQAILDYLKRHPDASIKDISINIEEVTENGVKSIIKALRHKGLLKHVGPDKGGHWEMNEDNEVQNEVSDQSATTQKRTQKTTQKSTQKKTKETTQKQQEILDYLKDHPEAGRQEIAIKIGGITEDGVKANLSSLQKRGLLKRLGPAKGGYWEVIGAEKE